MTYNKVIEMLCKVAVELNEKEDVKNYQVIRNCVVALDDIQMKIARELNFINEALGEDHDDSK